jgi:hypothetical protein
MKKKKLIKFISLAIAVFIIGYCVIWVSSYYRPSEEATAVFNNSASVEITRDKLITFTPKGQKSETGFIFYPGGKVTPDAYAPLCSKIAASGYKVIIAPMPLNLAILNGEKAKDVIAANPDIKNWVIGGHSLGGVMAASYAYKHPNQVKGLVLYAAYPQDKNNMSKQGLKVLSLWGTEDGCADLKKVLGAKSLVPEGSEFKAIEGGNHAQFGSYGPQKGDNSAKIPSTEQQSIAAQYTISLLSEVSK